MGNSPLVSVLIPVYNTEAYLEKCVDSILNQSYKNVEIILVDDGSPDNCPAICDELDGKYPCVKAFHTENGGSSSARNVCIDNATGDYVCFMDSDDYWDESDAMENLVRIALEKEVDVVSFGLKKKRASDGEIVFEKTYELEDADGLDTAQLFEKMVREGKVNISACLKLIKREFITDNDLYFKVGLKTEDLEWAIRFFACEPKTAVYPHSVYVYRIGREGSNTSTMDFKHLSDFCYIIESSVDVINAADEKLQPSLMSYLMYQTIILVALTGKVKMSREQRKEINSRLKDVCKKYLKKYDMDRKVQLAYRLYSVFGYGVMQKVLSTYLNHRGR